MYSIYSCRTEPPSRRCCACCISTDYGNAGVTLTLLTSHIATVSLIYLYSTEDQVGFL